MYSQGSESAPGSTGQIAAWERFLRCPVCGEALVREGGVLVCAGGHSFDIARQGYVNLLAGGAAPGTADTPEMVAARAGFLGGGHYAPLIAAVAGAVERAAEGVDGCILDAGAGTGEYLAAALERLPDRVGLALDISKHAARRSARLSPLIGAVVCDTWDRLPVADGAAAVVMSVFAPRNAAEFARVLARAGALVVAAPTPRHLAEIVEPLGMVTVDPHKEERLDRTLGGLFEMESNQLVEFAVALSADDAAALALMGPSARHTPEHEVRKRAAALGEPVSVTVSVNVSTWRPSVQNV